MLRDVDDGRMLMLPCDIARELFRERWPCATSWSARGDGVEACRKRSKCAAGFSELGVHAALYETEVGIAGDVVVGERKDAQEESDDE